MTRVSLLLCLAALSANSVAAADFFAGQITERTLHRLPDGGQDAVGGLGDWLITDGRLCAVVSDISHPTYLSLHGSALVDLWHCDLANDQWSVAHTQLNLQQDQIPAFSAITAGHGNAQAWVEARAREHGLETVVRYSIDADSPGSMRLETTVERYAEGEALSMFGALVLHPSASLLPYSIDHLDPAASRGFNIPDVDTGDWLSVLGSISTTNLQVLLGSRHIRPAISYALSRPEAHHIDADGSETVVQSFMIGGREFTMFGAFTEPFPGFWSDNPGLFSFGLGQLFDLEVGERFVFRQEVAVAAAAAATPFTDRLYTGARISGSLDTHEAGIKVYDSRDNPLTFARPDDKGQFSFALPENVADYRLAVETPWGNFTFEQDARSERNLGLLETGAPARLTLPVGVPMSLLFVRDDEQHIFNSELIPLTIADTRLLTGPESLRLNLSGTSADPVVAELPAGSYRVIASRGPEYDVADIQIELKAGAEVALPVSDLPRAVATPELIGVDFHVHSGVSFDSSLTPRQRVIDFVAQGGEVLVPTEHNVTYDLGPLIEDMGLAETIHSFPGVEITGMVHSEATPTTIGHSNVFPVEPDPGAFMGGTLTFEGLRLGQVIGAYKQRFADSIFQLNHPRALGAGDDLTFFDHLSQGVAFDPTAALDAQPNRSLIAPLDGTRFRDIDFDALELLNGGSMALLERVRRDWFALLRQNAFKVATANSDSHISREIVAYPRSYVVVEEDDPALVRTADIVRAVKRGALYGSTGPILRVSLADKGPGEVLAGSGGVLSVQVESAPWIDCSEVRIWINGELWQTAPLPASGQHTVAIDVDSDSFIYVEVLGEPGEVYSKLLPGFEPFAFANPIFVDVAGDGWRYGHP